MIECITNDNVKQFEKDFGLYIKENTIFFGVYSLLSVLYIYNAKKILKEYQSILIQNYNKESISFDEELLIDEKFSNIAKNNYRVYKKAKKVSPVEVLVLKGNYKQAIKLSKTLNLSIEQQKRIKNILENLSFSKINVSNILDWSEQIKNEKKFSLFNWQFLCSILAICIAIVSIVLVSTNDILKHGDGSKEHPYRIYTSADFEQVRNNPNGYYTLENSLDLTSFETISEFNGVLDCKYSTITTDKPIFDSLKSSALIKNGYIKIYKNCTIEDEYFGFLCNENEGKIQNIDVNSIDSDITLKFDSSKDVYTGIIAGKNDGIIEDCIIYNNWPYKKVITEMTNCGQNQVISGIVGHNGGKLIKCSNELNIFSNFQDIGGLCGFNDTNGEIIDCTNSGILSISNDSSTWKATIGGIASFGDGKIINSKNSAKISATSLLSNSYCGGIIGYLYENGYIEKCVNNGIVIAQSDQSSYTGGIVGNSQSNTIIKNCTNNSNITGTSTNLASATGGIVGNSFDNIEILSCTNNGEVKAQSINKGSFAGGIIGYLSDNSSIVSCINQKKISSISYVSFTYCGGIVGAMNSATVKNSKNMGYIYSSALASSCSGGIAGKIDVSSFVEYCINQADVYAYSSDNSSYAGGIVGYNLGSISYCIEKWYDVEGDNESTDNAVPVVGGIAALGTGNITYCISMAYCYGYYFGSIIGTYEDEPGTYSNNYWLYRNSYATYAEGYHKDNSIAHKYTSSSSIVNLSLYDYIINVVEGN